MDETPAPPGPPPRRWNWRPKARWFAAEIVVVVAGVLIALALNAWWGARSDAAREEVLLRQIVDDLEETERLMLEGDERAQVGYRANRQLIRAFYAAVPPPADSIFRWRRQLLRTPFRVPVLSSVESVILTGDRLLIRDPEIRFGLTDYLRRSEYWVEYHNRAYNVYRQQRQRFDEWVDYGEAVRATVSPEGLDSLQAADPLFPYAPGERVPFPFDPDEMVRNREVYNALIAMADARLHMRQSRERWRTRSVELREQIEAYLDE